MPFLKEKEEGREYQLWGMSKKERKKEGREEGRRLNARWEKNAMVQIIKVVTLRERGP